MTDAQSKHITHLINKFQDLAFQKYEAGTVEHEGNLWQVDVLPLLYELRNEMIDGFVYLQTAIDELEKK